MTKWIFLFLGFAYGVNFDQILLTQKITVSLFFDYLTFNLTPVGMQIFAINMVLTLLIISFFTDLASTKPKKETEVTE